jgi:thiol:disulfide interchange protein DsbD
MKRGRNHCGLGATGALCALVVGLAFCASPIAAADGTPKEKDSPPDLMPKEIRFQTALEPAEAKRGETVTLKVSAQIDPPWHIYKYAPALLGEGPTYTQFDVFDAAGLKVLDDWSAASKPTHKAEGVFEGLSFVEYHENEVTWSIHLEVPPDMEPGTKQVRCQVYFQLCSSGDGGLCLDPMRRTLRAAALTIVPGQATAAASTPKSTGAAPQAGVAPSKPASATPAPPQGKLEAAAHATAPANEAEQALAQGLWAFLLLAAGGGLMALVTPCVWPMVPVTVSFFVKQGHANRKRTVSLAIVYCLSIIGVFTLVGLVFSALFEGASLQRLAASAWLNLIVAALFIAFGLGLIGLFEFRLPSFLLNASAHGESRGGYLGVVFMALTLTITSFTCTFPVVGALLVMAASGSALYPLIGLATFATVLALPFLVLALAPGLIGRLPRSGDWMNAVKVIGGMIEIGAAVKFVNTAECAYVVPDEAWFNAPVVLTIWIALALVCGFYLLGGFKTHHDHDGFKVGPGRMMTGAFFVGLAVYLAPALFGHPPQGPIWDRLIVGMLPLDADKAFSAHGALAGDGEVCRPVRAISNDPTVAEREERTCHGVSWGMNFDEALKRAKAENKPVLIDFTGVSCANCRVMETGVMPRPDVVPLLSKYVTVQLYTDSVPIGSITADERTALAAENRARRREITNALANPAYAVLSPDGKVLAKLAGQREPSVFINFLKRGLAM